MQKSVGNLAKPVLDAGCVGQDRFAANIRRGGHQRRSERLHEKVVQRRVRQQEPDFAEAGRDGLGEPRVGLLCRQYDRALRVTQQRRLLWRRGGDFAGLQHRLGEHDGERFGRPPLARTQASDDRLGSRVAHQVVTADALDGDDQSVVQAIDASRQRGFVIANRGPAGLAELQRWPAMRTRQWLCVETSVSRIVVLGAAIGAEIEAGHCRIRSIVGQSIDDRVAWAALRAVGEGVTIAPGLRVGHFGQTIRANEMIGRNDYPVAPGQPALQDAEVVVVLDRGRSDFRFFRPGERRRFGGQPGDEARKLFRPPLGMDFDLAADIANPAMHVVPFCQPDSEGPEADALNPAAQADGLRNEVVDCHAHASGARWPRRVPRPAACAGAGRLPTRGGTRLRPRPCTARSATQAGRLIRTAGRQAG